MRTLLLLGSGEFEPWVVEAERAALARATGDGSVVILPTASAREGDDVFDRWGRMGLDHYASFGVEARVLPVKQRADAETTALTAAVADASMVFFSGGKPSYLASVLRGTPLWAGIIAAVDRGAVYGGCSAGAMVAGAAPREDRRRRFKPWQSGLDIVPGAVFGVHWDAIPRPLHPVRDLIARMAPRDVQFVGIDEQTAVLAANDTWQVFGEGAVAVKKSANRSRYRAGESFALGG